MWRLQKNVTSPVSSLSSVPFVSSSGTMSNSSFTSVGGFGNGLEHATIEHRSPPDRRSGGYWYAGMLRRLFENRREVTRLFAKNPFPDSPPRYLRSMVEAYWFTTPSERRETAAVWHVEEIGPFHRVVENPLHQSPRRTR